MQTITLEQVKADIASGKSTSIFISSKTCWWTHLSNDLKDATEQGKTNQITIIEQRLTDPEIFEDTKNMMRQHLKVLKGEVGRPAFLANIPLDPSGAPLLIKNPEKFISEAEGNPGFYGKYRLDALMKAHHQNCGGKVAQTWGVYNDMIEQENAN